MYYFIYLCNVIDIAVVYDEDEVSGDSIMGDITRRVFIVVRVIVVEVNIRLWMSESRLSMLWVC